MWYVPSWGGIRNPGRTVTAPDGERVCSQIHVLKPESTFLPAFGAGNQAQALTGFDVNLEFPMRVVLQKIEHVVVGRRRVSVNSRDEADHVSSLGPVRNDQGPGLVCDDWSFVVGVGDGDVEIHTGALSCTFFIRGHNLQKGNT